MKDSQLQDFKDFMESCNYAEGTIWKYTNALMRLPDEPENCTGQILFEHIKNALMNCKCSCTKYEYNQMRAAAHILFLQRTAVTVEEFSKKSQIPDQYESILTEFCEYSVHFRKITMKTAISERRRIYRFLSAVVENIDDVNWIQITALEIIEYIGAHLSHLTPTGKRGYVQAIRNLFRFLEFKGIQVHQSVFELPLTPANWKKNTLPVTLTENEVDRLLNHYRGDSAKHKRNSAVILVFLDLGLRCSEVTKLQLNDIHWNTGEVLIRGTKTNSERMLPLSDRLGKALETYVMHYRPKSSDTHLFLRLGRCEGVAVNKENIRRIVRFAFTKEHITGRLKGPHALRRTAASRVFSAGNSLKLTADILGHKVLDSTTAYVKIDIATLRTIVGNWPHGGEPC